MRSIDEALIISDLHLAAEFNRGLFQADETLAEFLRDVRTNFRHVHLFLNGDVFDFLVLQQRDGGLNLEDAADQATAIVNSHSEVFKELSLLANSDEHELVILAGNHDPEMALPVVQKEIARQLQSTGKHSPVQWLTSGEAALFQVGDLKVLIEHGDQYDAWNWIDHEALRRVICLVSRNISYQNIYKAPPGSQLVINRLNLLRDKFPWLQTLQPLNATILPLALEVILPSLSREDRTQVLKAVKEFNAATVRSVIDYALLRLGSRNEYWDNDNEDRQILSDWLAEYHRSEAVWGDDHDPNGWLARAMLRLRKILVSQKLKSVAGKNLFFDIEAHDENYNAVVRLTEKGANLVVHGHTHAAKAYQVGPSLYLNTGTWGQLTKLPAGEATDEVWGRYLEELKAGRADSITRPTFAWIKKQGIGTAASLFEWTTKGARALSTWNFANGQWEEEK